MQKRICLGLSKIGRIGVSWVIKPSEKHARQSERWKIVINPTKLTALSNLTLATVYFGYIDRNSTTERSIWQALITIYIPRLRSPTDDVKLQRPGESRLSLKDN